MAPPRARSLAFVAGLFFLSGLTGLVYEVIWAKYFALLLGSTTHAQMGVLAVFMGGLAMGAALWGNIADRTPRPLALYGWLEIVIGTTAAAFALGFDVLSRAYWMALSVFPPPQWESRVVQASVCVLGMGVPTLCMGGTLPVLARAFGLSRTGFGKGVALLYGLNSAGAAAGAGLAGFVLVPRWGLDSPFLAAAVCNLLLGGVAVWLGRRWRTSSTTLLPAESTGESEPASLRTDLRAPTLVIPLAAALTGAMAMVYEVGWIRLCSLVLGSSTYAFSIMLTAFIIGIAAGSFVFRFLAPARRMPIRFFVFAALFSATVVLVCVPWYERLPYWFGRLLHEVQIRNGGFAAYQVASLCLWVLVMLPLTFSNGLIFPALAHAAAQVFRGVGRPVSTVLAANTLGTILGTVVGALYLIPTLGLEWTFRLAALLTACSAVGVLAADRSLSTRRLFTATTVVSLLFVGVLAWSPRWDVRLLVAGEFRRHSGIPASTSFAAYKKEFTTRLLYYRDGATATVSVEDSDSDRIVRVNGKSDASLAGDRETQLLVGHLPALVSSQRKRALLIGFGSGMTTSAVARHPFEHIDVVEISPEMIEASAHFRDWIGPVLEDPRLRLHIEDARTFLFRTPHRYDVIISEPSNPWVAGVSSLFTVEFFEQIRQRLSRGGVLVQWLHTYETSDEVVKTLLRTLIRSFPEVHLFQSNFGDLLALASMKALQVDPVSLASTYEPARRDLEPIGLGRGESVLALEIAPRRRLEQVVGEGPLNRDRAPVVEYLAPRAFFAGDFATLFQNLPTRDDDGYLLPAAELPLEALTEWAAYVHRLDLLRQANSVRILAAWFARTPRAAEWRGAAVNYLHAEPRRLRLISALRDSNCPHLNSLVDCAHGVLELVAAVPYPPNARFLQEMEDFVRRAAAEAKSPSLLLILANLYVHAREPEVALRLLDAASSAWGENAEFLARAPCVRGHAWEQLGNTALALHAYGACKPTNADEAARLEAAKAKLRAAGS